MKYLKLCNLLLHLSRSEDDLDSDIEETLYGHVHYASSLLVSENSTPGMKFLNRCLLQHTSTQFYCSLVLNRIHTRIVLFAHVIIINYLY